MNPFILALLIILIVVISVAVIALTIAGAKKDAEHSFSCPNCGRFFRANWKKLLPSWILNRAHRVGLSDKLLLRCPHCNQKDLCKMHGEED